MSLNTVTEQDRGLAAYHHKSQTHSAGPGAKGKVYPGATEPGRMVGLHLKDHLIFLFTPEVLIKIGRGRHFFHSITFQTFGALYILSIHLSSFSPPQYKKLPLPPCWPVRETSQCSN